MLKNWSQVFDSALGQWISSGDVYSYTLAIISAIPLFFSLCGPALAMLTSVGGGISPALGGTLGRAVDAECGFPGESLSIKKLNLCWKIGFVLEFWICYSFSTGPTRKTTRTLTFLILFGAYVAPWSSTPGSVERGQGRNTLIPKAVQEEEDKQNQKTTFSLHRGGPSFFGCRHFGFKHCPVYGPNWWTDILRP